MSQELFLRPYGCISPAFSTAPLGRLGGDRYEILRGHEELCARYGQFTAEGQRSLRSKLMSRIASTDLLRIAVEHILQHGGGAPGPNRQRLDRLWNSDGRPNRRSLVFQELTRLRDEILGGSYRPAPPRTVRIPKANGQTRPIAVFDWQDLVVQRAIVQTVQPLVDPTFASLSFGFRPRRGPAEAVATALAIAERDERFVWLAVDIQDAFGNVPHDELINLIEARFPDTELRNAPGAPDLPRLIRTFLTAHLRSLGRGGRSTRPQRGISQGGGLSPLLLNILLDATVDQRWMGERGRPPLIRYADDLLILCRSAEEGLEALRSLRELLPGGMRLKGTPEADIADLRAGDSAEWMGWTISMDGRIRCRPSRRRMEYLEAALRLEREGGDFPLRVPDMLRGFVDQLGPCYEHVDREDCVRRIRRAAMNVGAVELPSVQDLKGYWDRSFGRFRRLCHLARQQSQTDWGSGGGSGDGFADRQTPRTASSAAAELEFSSEDYGCPFNLSDIP